MSSDAPQIDPPVRITAAERFDQRVIKGRTPVAFKSQQATEDGRERLRRVRTALRVAFCLAIRVSGSGF